MRYVSRKVGFTFKKCEKMSSLWLEPGLLICFSGQNFEIHGSIPARAARLGTSQAELKDGTTRAPILRFLSCQRAMELKPS
ncbi:hypothetical protein YC2023_114944 [Brassica napus]